MLAIGTIIAKILYEEYGIEVLHLKNIFDLPYDTAYQKSLTAIQAAKQQYPTIKYAFDLHRDGMSNTPERAAIYRTAVAGQPAAKVMMVPGTTAENNLKFANEVQKTMQSQYPDLFKSIYEKPYKYNRFVFETSMFFEIGSNLSTPSEAKNTAVFLARVLGIIITSAN